MVKRLNKNEYLTIGLCARHSAQMGTNMRRLSTMQLLPGMIAARDVVGFDGEQLLAQGTKLTDKLITKLEMYGVLTVFIEDSIPLPPPSELVAAPREPSYSQRIRLTPAFQEFKREYTLNLDSFRSVINAVVEKNVKLDIDALLKQSLDIAALGQGQVGILAMLQNMREYDDSTYTHCINVALLCNVFAGWLHFDKPQIELATSCGLLHDLGKLLVPHNILTKPSNLTENEYEKIQQHPIDGYQLLKAQGVNIHIQNAALMHHERIDGSGYPLHYRGSQIDKYARIVAIADVYDAMTATRVYRGPMCPFRVIEIFESEGFQKYDVEFLLVILQNIVNTYIQNRCRLSDGREGDIIYINKDKLSRPVVQCGTQYVNLAEYPDLTVEALL